MALIGLAQDGKNRIFDDSVITPATARGFANGFFLGYLRDVLLWSRSSRGPVNHRQVVVTHIPVSLLNSGGVARRIFLPLLSQTHQNPRGKAI